MAKRRKPKNTYADWGRRPGSAPKSKIEKDPKKPDAFDLTEAGFSGALGSDDRLLYLTRLGIFGSESLHTLGTKLPWYLTVLHDPVKANTNVIYRPLVASLADTLVSLILSDWNLYQRVVFDLQKVKGREVGVNEETVESEPPAEMPERSYWKVLTRHRETGTLHDELEILARDPDRRFNLDGFREKLRAGLREMIPADAKA
jgi:hypothetical protein